MRSQMIMYYQMRMHYHLPMHHCAIDDELHGRGLKKTHPRHRIVELFQKPQLWSARTIAKHLHDVGQATIYRTLRTLQREGVITTVRTSDEDATYERADQQHHDHLVCSNCHVIECLPCPAPKLPTHTLELQGNCSSCNH